MLRFSCAQVERLKSELDKVQESRGAKAHSPEVLAYFAHLRAVRADAKEAVMGYTKTHQTLNPKTLRALNPNPKP